MSILIRILSVFRVFLTKSKNARILHIFWLGGGGGEEATPEYRILGSEENTWCSPYSSRILLVFYRITEYAEYGQNTDHVFWWTEYLVFCPYSVYSLLVDRIPYSVKKQNTDRIRTEYGQNTVITKRAIVITNRTPPSCSRRRATVANPARRGCRSRQ